MKPNASEQSIMGTSITHLLKPPNGYPDAKSKPNITQNNPATTNPKIHRALDMKSIPSHAVRLN
jgi:hypothetical protein